MVINHWYQMQVKTANEVLGGRFNGEIEGPLDWKQVLDRAQEIIDVKADALHQIPHYAEVTKVELGEGALYENGRYGWSKGEPLPGLEKLPSYIGASPIITEQQHGHLLLRYCNSGKDIAVKEFVEEGMGLDWVLAARALEKVLVFEATITPVATIGADPTVVAENSGYPDAREPSLLKNHVEQEVETGPAFRGSPIVGFRCWRLVVPSKLHNDQIIDSEPKLYGPNYHLPFVPLYEWNEVEKQAECPYHGNHVVSAKCESGVYAFHELDDNAMKPYYAYSKLSIETGVRGAVLGSGDVLVHNNGWRAQAARIIGFDGDTVPDRFRPALQRIAQRFDVPILGTDELIALAHRKGRVLRKSDLEGLQ